jgi:esterase/lipase
MSENLIKIPKSTDANLSAMLFTTSNQLIRPKFQKPPFVILCHGFTGNKFEWGRFPKTANKLNEAGFDALIFDFSGSGENKREPILLSKQIHDLEDVYNWVRKQGYEWISILGLSFGGLTALLTNLTDIKAYVFWAPAFYMHESIKNYLSILFTSQDQSNKESVILKLPNEKEGLLIDRNFADEIERIKVENYLKKLIKPTLILQGTADSSVKLESTRKAFTFLPKDDHHKLIELKNATHNFTGKHLTNLIELTTNWLRKYV